MNDLPQRYSRYLDQQEEEEEAFDENNVLRDGRSARVPMFLMDGKTITAIDSIQRDADTQKRNAIDRYNARLKDAWRNDAFNKAPAFGGTKLKPNSGEEEDPDEEEEKRKAAFKSGTKDAQIERYNARISDAWKMDKFAGGHGHSYEDPDEEEEKSKRIKAASKIPGRDNRDAAYKSYDARVANAWKTP